MSRASVLSLLLTIPILGASLIYQGPMDKVVKNSIVLSKDFSHVAFVVKEEKGRVSLFLDGKPQGKFRGILRGSLKFLNGELFFIALDKKGWKAHWRGRETKRYQVIYPDSLVFKEGKFAFVGKRGEDFFVNINGVEFGPYREGVLRDSIKLGRGYFFVVKKGKKWEAIFYGKSMGLYPLILAKTIEISPDWKHVAFITEGKPQVLYLDGKQVAKYDFFLSQYVHVERKGKFFQHIYGPRLKFTDKFLIFYGVKGDKIYLEKIPL